ncbi:MAG TPA: SAM-dependent methyltransferase [Cryomorphaceae bacterium]|nr:SAM-dependent methyltransferase [Cryomorphaceae bacterium]
METALLNARTHWEHIYETKTTQQVSWTQEDPQPSLDWILKLALDPSSFIVDSGGGRSLLAEKLTEQGFSDVEVFDISMRALTQARQELKSEVAREAISYRVCNVLDYKPEKDITVWHDRAVFHFLVDEDQRGTYIDNLKKWAPKHVILGTFSPNGPLKCSGLPIQQYAADDLVSLFAPEYTLVRSEERIHVTPTGNTQAFTFVELQRA